MILKGADREALYAEIYDGRSSEFYDYHAKRNDIAFYSSLVSEAGDSSLEIGCGTGRILIPLARTGIRMTGLDSSGHMLDICRRKLEPEPEEVKRSTRLVRDDMRSFDLGESFSSVIVPFGPFNSLSETGDQLECLGRIRKHLKPGGFLAMDLFYPDIRQLAAAMRGCDVVRDTAPFEMPDGGSVVWGLRFVSADFNRQWIEEELVYDVVDPGGGSTRLVYPSKIRYFFRAEAEHLLERSGFDVTKVCSDFEGTEFGGDYPCELIMIARGR